MSGPKTITEREVGDVTYELKHWESDGKYVIYKWDSKLLRQSAIAQRIPEVGVFDTESEAREVLEKLDIK